MRFCLAALALVALAACDSENPLDPIDEIVERRVTDLAAPPSGPLVYFSLRENRVVPAADSLTDRWDLAFRGTRLRVNGGVRRAGEGGAVFVDTLFAAVTAAPTSGYAEEGGIAPAIPDASGEGWYELVQNTVRPIPNRVLVLRTGDGRYAKLLFESYYRGAPALPTATSEPGYYTFRYVFQPDGSRSFESN